MNGHTLQYTLGQINRREERPAPDTAPTFDGGLSSSDDNPSLVSTDGEVQQWDYNLFPGPLLEPAMPTSFTPFDYPLSLAPSFDAQSSWLDDLIAFHSILNPPIFSAPLTTNPSAPHSPSLNSQSGSSAAPTSPDSSYAPLSFHDPSLNSQSGSSVAPTSPASSDASLSFHSPSSLSLTSWPVPIALTPPQTATPTTTPYSSSPTLLETLVADTEAETLGVNLIGLRATLDPSYHAALYAAFNAIAAATDGEKPPKEALSPLLRTVDGKDKKDRRWFCRFRGCRWANAGYNRSDRAIAHLLKDHFGTRFDCKEPACGRVFKWKHDLQAHVKRDHAPDGVAPARILCQYCGNDFSKKSNLDRHIREGICPSFGGGPGKVKSKASRARKTRAVTIRANIKPDDDEYQVTHSNHRQVC